VASAIRGKRGQAFLRELVAALDAMPVKRLVKDVLIEPTPAFVPPEYAAAQVCAIGSVGVQRGVNMEDIDHDNPKQVGDAFGIPHQLAAEIEYLNDEAGYEETPEARWWSMRQWAVSQLKGAVP
jgi:hypothetical protein